MTREWKLLDLVGRRYLKRWLLLAAVAVMVGVMELVGALLVFVLIDSVMSPQAQAVVPIVGDVRARFGDIERDDFLVWLGLAVAVFFLLRALVFIGQTYLQHRLAQHAAVRLATRLFGMYLRMPYALHLRRNSAELIRNVHHSVQQIAIYGFVPLVIVASEGLLAVGIVVALLVTSVKVTGVLLLVAVPLAILLMRASRRAMVRIGETSQEMATQTISYLQQSLHGIRDIKVLRRTSFFERRFAASRVTLARSFYLRGVLSEVPRVVTETMFAVALGSFLSLTILVGGSLSDSVATLGLFAYAGVRLMPSINRIVTNVNNLQFAQAAVNTIHSEVESLRTTETRTYEEHPRLQLLAQITIENLRFRYDREEVLNGIHLSIAKGSSLGIVGPTGSGKSTLMDVMMGLLEPTGGTVKVDGLSIHDRPDAWQQSLGVVPQSPFLLDDTLRRNIALGLTDEEIDDDWVSVALVRAQLESFVESLPNGLDTVVGERGVRLSGGQRQRVAIARALYGRPDVLFFDEATSALDRITEERLIGTLEVLPDQTIVMVAHRLSTLKRCDQIALLQDGRLEDVGAYEELIERNTTFRAMAR